MDNRLSHNWLIHRKRERAVEESTEGASTSSSNRANKESAEGASTSSSISPEATIVGSSQLDVFLSFSGSDTRKDFTDHLYHNLETVGIRVFKDDESIPIGERFDKCIINAITESKISIPIISKNYASSKWCLRELACMMNHKNPSHTVLPIFYKVSPSNVKDLKGKFGDAFSRSLEHFDENESQKVQEALKEVGRFALEKVGRFQGWESTKFANGHEGALVKSVVETVRSKLQENIQLDVPEKVVGMDDDLVKIMNWIDSPSTNARMIGIYGMSGIGKTTLAKCIVNRCLCLNKFEHVSFLPNIQETAGRHGLEHLQKQLISDILKYKNEVTTFHEEINTIKHRLKRKNVLIVLDDVNEDKQLNALARKPDWFGKRSVIIVTTKNKEVLEQSKFKVDFMHGLNRLNEAQSLLLFNIHAFHMSHSPRVFGGIPHKIVSIMDGLPLALQVVGSSLYSKTDLQLWKEMLGKLESQPHEGVIQKLRISYDALEEKEYKEIFLDIACFFIGENGKLPMHMWEDRGFSPSLGIDKLKSRCLIKIGYGGKFEMHDQLRDLGRSIFCERQLLECCSGPWDDNYKGVPRVLRQNECWRRFDDLIRAASSGDKDLSEVGWLQWYIDKSGLSLSKANLHLPKLAVLDLGWSKITEDWKGWSSFRASTRLRVLNLTQCWNLRSTPDLSTFTKLQILIMNHCRNLKHLHHSIGKLESLVSLDLTYCISLKELPKEVGELKDLEELDLSWSGITQIPTSICSLDKLKKLHASHCCSLRGIPSSIGDLQNLQHLNLSYTRIGELPSAIRRLKNLQTLDVSWTPISCVPERIRNLLSSSSVRLIMLPQFSSLFDDLYNSKTSHVSSKEALDVSRAHLTCRKAFGIFLLSNILTYMAVTTYNYCRSFPRA